MGFLKKEVSVEDLFEAVKERFSPENLDLIKRAYDVSNRTHADQKRYSGEPYVIHPVNVAYILNDLKQEPAVVAAGLLHDVIEDTSYTREDMTNDFGKDITKLVEGVTKMSKVKNKTRMNFESIAAENLRRMLMATAKDPRIIVIKLADKTHNMRTLKFHKPEKQKIIAQETLSIYAPLAGRLGVYKIKSELEDLAFQILEPEKYQEIKEKVASKKAERDSFIETAKIIIKQRLAEINLDVQIEGRSKHFYSIYKKMKDKDKTFDEINDLRAIRIITKEVRDCYGVFGVVHSIWTPVPGKFKDYIATPKTNQYQSLHTAVIGQDGRPFEIQIRTAEMNHIAEHGIAAHWAYKEGTKSSKDVAMTAKWIEKIRAWSESSSDSKEFLEDLTHELHEDEVFVFTPKGDIYNFPKGSTILDYAFRIHTDVGIHAKGAKIGGRMVPLRTELKSGDQIEVITDKKVKPSPIWLRIVKTSSAKQKLRQYFRKVQDETASETANAYAAKTVVADQPLPEIDLTQLKKLKPDKKKNKEKREISIVVAGIKDILVRLSSCCSPLPGDEIVGFITRGRGVSVHKANCDVALHYSDKKRIVAVRWDGVNNPVPVRIEVKAYDRQGIYLEMVESISKTETNILEAGASSSGESTLLARFLIEIEHLDQLQEILDNIRSIKNVLYAERVMEK
ncbi:MAG TPA: bifunctional (p)ppGpp synthetase/guanosine-3',5'-bis(diphosphate) 3'-pyrophosphohydrolase [Leptospiraceae bacterium]|nr:bifunctional (p)ppGpp synthetase/guanosine-3',5'-bis(diphosphate) 3'-pyrophosphohydrolase [Leptospiraceae bacterium]HMW07105.1 bifunctional (p)ppGpp synthetase/guanosine-3',5'-bis(diphosphate) 3'-pyrophosphohydrolase [Leptospiraceae bacterium]HMX31779.1 bifunctional (p)ppGpp synthetase/guanosine-3',5'-bis(diphosphate) 3'-pyrophosphohydrolase [Leptospiraceae bacterium]HMY32578.1 bifunctional (p)ppGpp synthetase/guanosine-3',5'-bis(diphosphate) 3'-pyrophosphohydrolase [Leptospiraceae bacterium]